MATWSGRATVLLASVSILAACGGGQTGQPGSGPPCERRRVPADERVQGVSPADLGQAFAGHYTSTLKWTVIVPSPSRQPISTDDAISVDVTYEGADGTTCDDLQVETVVEIATRDSGVRERSTVLLVAPEGVHDGAIFSLSGTRVDAEVELLRSQGVVTISGELHPLTGDLPGDVGKFSPEP